jgi:hypothetical protein
MTLQDFVLIAIVSVMFVIWFWVKDQEDKDE